MKFRSRYDEIYSTGDLSLVWCRMFQCVLFLLVGLFPPPEVIEDRENIVRSRWKFSPRVQLGHCQQLIAVPSLPPWTLHSRNTWLALIRGRLQTNKTSRRSFPRFPSHSNRQMALDLVLTNCSVPLFHSVPLFPSPSFSPCDSSFTM